MIGARYMSQAACDSRRSMGAAGEAYTVQLLRANGYDVQPAQCRKSGDLWVNDRRIEVKTARQRRDGKFSFQLYVKTRGVVRTDYRNSDTIILNAVFRSGAVATFVVPVDVLGERHTITIPGNLGGKWSEFRVRRGMVRL